MEAAGRIQSSMALGIHFFGAQSGTYCVDSTELLGISMLDSKIVGPCGVDLQVPED